MPVESSVLFAALWLTEQGKRGLKQPVQQQIYGFVGLSCTCGVVLWIYFSGAIARVLLQLHWKSCGQGRANLRSPVQAFFLPWGGPSRKQRRWPLSASSIALCWVQFSPAQGLPSPFLQAKLAKLLLSWPSETHGTHMLRLNGWQTQTRAANNTLMPWPTASRAAPKVAMTQQKCFVSGGFANGSQQRKIQHGYLSELHKAGEGCEKVPCTCMEALRLSASGHTHF